MNSVPYTHSDDVIYDVHDDSQSNVSIGAYKLSTNVSNKRFYHHINDNAALSIIDSNNSVRSLQGHKQ